MPEHVGYAVSAEMPNLWQLACGQKQLSWLDLQFTQDGDAADTSTSSRDGTPAASQEQLEDVVLHSTNQFYKWHSELEAAFASETEEKYKQYGADLQGRLDCCDDILSKVSNLLCVAGCHKGRLQMHCTADVLNCKQKSWHAGGCNSAIL